MFAPVARLDIVRLLISHAAHEGWEAHHMDVKPTFLNEDLQEEVFVQQLPRFVFAGKEHKVLKLKSIVWVTQGATCLEHEIGQHAGVI